MYGLEAQVCLGVAPASKPTRMLTNHEYLAELLCEFIQLAIIAVYQFRAKRRPTFRRLDILLTLESQNNAAD